MDELRRLDGPKAFVDWAVQPGGGRFRRFVAGLIDHPDSNLVRTFGRHDGFGKVGGRQGLGGLALLVVEEQICGDPVGLNFLDGLAGDFGFVHGSKRPPAVL
jgi:hypothetical protein